MVNNYGIDERTPALAGDAAEGVMGIQDVAYWGENVPGMKTLMDCAREAPSQRHPRLALHAGLAVDDPGRRGHQARGPEPDRRGVKKALESLKEFDTWGITPPFTYTSEDHRPTNRARLVHGQGRQGRTRARGLGGPRHEVDRQVASRWARCSS